MSMLLYEPEVAVPRIVETYKKFDIRQTFFVPAWCIENYPAAVETILATTPTSTKIPIALAATRRSIG